jgi:patatin-like phospholipase/acyl hydrolase
MFNTRLAVRRLPLINHVTAPVYSKISLFRSMATTGVEPPKEEQIRDHTEQNEPKNDPHNVQEQNTNEVDPKTAEELKNEAEKARKKLEEMRDIETLFRKFLLRGLRLVLVICSVCLL